jgi:hypothetical protein
VNGADEVLSFFLNLGGQFSLSVVTVARMLRGSVEQVSLICEELERRGDLQRAPRLDGFWQITLKRLPDAKAAYEKVKADKRTLQAKRIADRMVIYERRKHREEDAALSEQARQARLADEVKHRAEKLVADRGIPMDLALALATKRSYRSGEQQKLVDDHLSAIASEASAKFIAERRAKEQAREEKNREKELRRVARLEEQYARNLAKQKAAREYAERLPSISLAEVSVTGAHFPKVLVPSKPKPVTGVVVKEVGPDPWAKIRARHYAKPPLLASNLRQLTPEELKTGRTQRQA